MRNPPAIYHEFKFKLSVYEGLKMKIDCSSAVEFGAIQGSYSVVFGGYISYNALCMKLQKETCKIRVLVLHHA